MKQILPCLLKDGYKAGHPMQYPDLTEFVYSNLTARGSRVPGVDRTVFFGAQYFVQEYLIKQFNESFFGVKRYEVERQYKRRMDNYLGPDSVPTKHICELHEFGCLPLLIKAVPEGTRVPFRTPMMTWRNTDNHFGWLTNMPETLLSNVLWQPITSATTAFSYRQKFERFASMTGADPAFVKWQGHDFSMRGLPGIEAACLSGAAHLLSFWGTDTIPAIDFLETYYGADCTKELIGGSVAATEHSVMCVDGSSRERDTIKRLITEVYPSGIVSIVCDTWDFWNVVNVVLPSLKAEIMARNGKVVVRPDSGDPVNVVRGDPDAPEGSPEWFGAVRLLAKHFGTTKNAEGFLLLDPHVGVIYGDSITPERQEAILRGLFQHGFASSNVVLGIGSYTYQYVTRDTYGLAVKATWAQVAGEQRNIFKTPKTDGGIKNSACGLLHVNHDGKLTEQCSWEQERTGLLQPIFHDGEAKNLQTLSQIRSTLECYL